MEFLRQRNASITRAFCIVGLARSTVFYKNDVGKDQTVIDRMKEIAHKHRQQEGAQCRTVVDDFTKESIGIFPDHSISGAEVTRHLELTGRRPTRIRSDNGPEFLSMAFLDWTQDESIEHELITPGKPNENAFIESLNSRFRDECVNEHVFCDLPDARRKIAELRKEYNELHPFSSLGMKSPEEFVTYWRECYDSNAL